jgi:hypothetical protein
MGRGGGGGWGGGERSTLHDINIDIYINSRIAFLKGRQHVIF